MAEPLGKATVQIDGDNSGLKKSIQEAKQEVSSLDGATEQTSKKARDMYSDLEGYFDNLRNQAARADRQARGFGSTLATLEAAGRGLRKTLAIISIPTAAIAAGFRLGRAIQEARREAELFDKSLRDIAASSANTLQAAQQSVRGVADIAAETTRVQNEARASINQIISSLQQQLERQSFAKENSVIWQRVVGAASSNELIAIAEQRIKQVNAATANTVDLLRRQDAERQIQAEAELQSRLAAEREKALEDTLGRFSALARNAQIQILPEPEQIRARLEDAIAAAQDAVDASGVADDADVSRLVQQYIAFLVEKARLDQAALDERIANEQKAEIEKGKQVAKANADAMEREMSAALERLNTSFGFNSGGLNNIVGAINGLRTEVQRRRN